MPAWYRPRMPRRPPSPPTASTWTSSRMAMRAVLTQVAANGNAVVTSKPLAVPGRQLSETHVLRSETLEMKMRPGGREMESVVTKAPGTLEFLPNLPAQHHRMLDGKDFVIAYGPAEPRGQLPRDQRQNADRPDGGRAPPQSAAEHHHQPGTGGALRPQDQPPGEHAADRRLRLRRRRPQSPRRQSHHGCRTRT